MNSEIIYMLGVVLVGFAVNYALRALPFLLFAGRGRALPPGVARFGALVSPVIIAGLIVYSYSGLAWRTPWPYVAGALTVALQLWRRNPLLSIVAGTVLYMCVLSCGCTSERVIGLDAARPSIRVSTQGYLVGKNYVEPQRIPKILKSYDIPCDRVIHIMIDEGVEKDLGGARTLMGLLAKAGYTRSVLVTKKRAESSVLSDEDVAERARARNLTPSPAQPKPQVRYRSGSR